MGNLSCESFGDYTSGSNHVLPTYGAARAFGGLSIDCFMKKISFQTVTREGVIAIAQQTKTLAAIEGLDAHLRAANKRLEAINNELL